EVNSLLRGVARLPQRPPASAHHSTELRSDNHGVPMLAQPRRCHGAVWTNWSPPKWTSFKPAPTVTQQIHFRTFVIKCIRARPTSQTDDENRHEATRSGVLRHDCGARSLACCGRTAQQLGCATRSQTAPTRLRDI